MSLALIHSAWIGIIDEVVHVDQIVFLLELFVHLVFLHQTNDELFLEESSSAAVETQPAFEIGQNIHDFLLFWEWFCQLALLEFVDHDVWGLICFDQVEDDHEDNSIAAESLHGLECVDDVLALGPQFYQVAQLQY